MPETTEATGQALTGRYLVQFRRQDHEEFKTDCGFRDGQLDLARYHVHLVLETLGDVAQGRVWDTQAQRCVYQYPRDVDVSSGEEIVPYQRAGGSEDASGSEGTEREGSSAQTATVEGSASSTPGRLQRDPVSRPVRLSLRISPQ